MTAAPTPAPTGWLARVGLAIMEPRWAFAIAGDRGNAGRSGSDLIALIGILLLATQLRGLVIGVWVGAAISASLGLHAITDLLTRALTIDLALLVIGALVLYAVAGARRRLGRAFDLACVAAVPLVIVELVAVTTIRALDVDVPPLVGYALSAASYGWYLAVLALAIVPARNVVTVAVQPPVQVVAPAKRAGAAVAAIAFLGVAVQGVWVARNLELLRPMQQGDAAPQFALPAIGPGGALAAPVSLAGELGHVVVIDFWATWCGPCLASLPRLDALARAHPDVRVLAIDLDDPVAARALFDQRGYRLTLLMNDRVVDQRYGVQAIPHTVLVDPAGRVRSVLRGGEDLEAEVAAILQK